MTTVNRANNNTTTASSAPVFDEPTGLVTSLPRVGTSRLRGLGLPAASAVAVALVISVGAAVLFLSGFPNRFAPYPRGAEVADANANANANATVPAQAEAEAANPVGGQLDDGQPEVESALTGATRFQAVEAEPVYETGQAEPLAPGQSVTVDLADVVDPSATAVAVAVDVRGASATGPLTAAFDAGTVTVVDVQAQMVSQLAIVPRNGETPLTLTSVSGGLLTVRVVGQFVPSQAVGAGRLVAVEPVVIGSLATAVDGNAATFAPVENAAIPTGGVDSVLVRIVADIGDDGGTVRIGSNPDDLSQSLMWGPTAAGDRTRMSLAIVALDELEQLSLDYQGGAELQVQLLAFITGEGAPISTNGLFVPLPVSQPVADTVIGSVAVSTGNGLTIVPVEATGRLDAALDLPGEVDIIGYFLA